MVATYQYPQYLYALRGTEATQNSDGVFVPGTTAWELVAICREETNGKGSTLQVAGGQYIEYSSLVQLPKGSSFISEGTEVVVMRTEIAATKLADSEFIVSAQLNGDLIIRDTCKKFDLGRLHCRLWV